MFTVGIPRGPPAGSWLERRRSCCASQCTAPRTWPIVLIVAQRNCRRYSRDPGCCLTCVQDAPCVCHLSAAVVRSRANDRLNGRLLRRELFYSHLGQNHCVPAQRAGQPQTEQSTAGQGTGCARSAATCAYANCRRSSRKASCAGANGASDRQNPRPWPSPRSCSVPSAWPPAPWNARSGRWRPHTGHRRWCCMQGTLLR
jgi:hypothetical protein